MKDTYTPHLYIHGWPHRSQTDTWSTHTNTGSSDSLSLLIPGQYQEVSSESVPSHTGWTTPVAGLRHSVCLMDGPWIPVSQLLAPGCLRPPM